MSENKVVLLGTKGGPRMEKGLSWSTCSVIEVDGHPYIVDCGLGVTRQFVEAGYSLSQVDNIFLTHHHSDHNLEFGPLVHTLWTSGTSDKVDVYGPEGFDMGFTDIYSNIDSYEFTESEYFFEDASLYENTNTICYDISKSY